MSDEARRKGTERLPDGDATVAASTPNADTRAALTRPRNSNASSPAGEGAALIGTVLAGRYKLLECIGEGGMGAVFKAEQLALRRYVAVKLLLAHVADDIELRARFEREALAVASLEHPNVVAAIDFGVSDGRFFMVMEYVDGATLRRLLSRGERLAPARVLHIARQIGAALARAHGAGIVHRDLKPENVVLVDREGDRDFVKVIDFGVARVAERVGGAALTQVGAVIGTLQYMAPEQALGGRVDHRADLFALGVMVFEMLVGKRPFEADNLGALVARYISEPPPRATAMVPPGTLPASVDAVLIKILASSPSARYASAAEFIAELDAAFGSAGTPVFAAPASGTSGGPSTSLTGNAPAPSPTVASTGSAPRHGVHHASAASSRLRLGIGIAAAVLVVVAAGAFAMRAAVSPGTATEAPATALSIARDPTLQPAIGEPGAPRASSATGAATVTPANARETSMPPELAERLAAFRTRGDVVRILGRARRGYLTEAIQWFEAAHRGRRDQPFSTYFLGTMYARVPAGLGPALDRYRDVLRMEPGFAADETLIRDVVRAYTAGERHADTVLRGSLANTARNELLAVATGSSDGRARQRATAALVAPPFDGQLDASERARLSH